MTSWVDIWARLGRLFPEQYLRGAVLVSLLSVWVLVLLFHYLNRFTKREYFRIWTAAWLFYALWLTLGMELEEKDVSTTVGALRLCCIGFSATFLLWGSLNFLNHRVRPALFGWFIAFLIAWGLSARFVLTEARWFQWPVFILNGGASLFAAFAFYRSRQKHQLVGVGMLCLGFGLWGLYLFCYPFTQEYPQLISAVFFFSAILQLFIAVSMIVLVIEDVRKMNQQIEGEIASVTSEKEALQKRMVTAELRNRSLMDEARLNESLKQAYEDLRQTQESVMQMERMRALGEMASGIAHDINNSLTPLMLMPEMILSQDRGISPESRDRLTTMHMAAMDVSHVVARMKQFYRREQEKEALAEVKLNLIVEQVVNLTRPRWRDMPQQRGLVVEIDRHLQPDLPLVMGNESEIREALINLLMNAVDAMPQGGKISITTKAGSGWRRADAEAPRNHVLLELRDSGVGMDQHTLRHCLDPFFTTKGKRGGTGLGLAMVYGTMERHDGSLQVESQPGQGTTVHLIFPIQEQPVSTDHVTHPPEEQVPSLRILYVDDEPLLRSVLKDLLETLDHKVVAADGGQNGVTEFRQARMRGEAFDVVITDLGMPQVDGRQVARTIKAESPETPVILLTGWGMMLNSSDAIPDADELVCKPPRLRELSAAIGRVHKNRKREAAKPA